MINQFSAGSYYPILTILIMFRDQSQANYTAHNSILMLLKKEINFVYAWMITIKQRENIAQIT